MAVLGQEEKDGEFCVKDVMVAGLPPQKPLPSLGTLFDRILSTLTCNICTS